MMGRRSIKWLLSELPTLESEGVIDGATATRLRAHYEKLSAGTSRRLVLAIFAVFGALLIGGGVILLLAHNWEALSRGTRAAIALTPLLMSQALVAWVILRRRGSTAWREGSATLLALTVATSLALVDQTYHTGGDLESFLWRWSLLLATLPWLLNATSVAIIFLGALTWWAGAAKVEGMSSLWLWPLALAVAPHALQVIRSDRRGLRAANLQWAIAIFVCVAAGIGLEHRVPGLWIVVYCGLFALMVAAGAAVRRGEEGLWRRPLEVVGVAGSVGLWLILTFDDVWRHIGWDHVRITDDAYRMASWFDVLLAVGLPLAAIVAMVVLFDRRRQWQQILWALSVPVVAIVWPVVAATGEEWPGALAFNLLVFSVGIASIAIGVRNQDLGTVNLGLIVVALLVVVRFFDSGLGFVAKGLVFILVGVGFLVANILLSRSLEAEGGGGV